uniref:Adenylate kinase 5 n=1 Tax=Naja naja TaxID=35670 RepID=A0A8C6V837_NAJNA
MFQSLLNGLMCCKPDDPVEYLESCLQKVKELGGAEKVKWDTFVSPEKRSLPPLNGNQSRRAFFRNVMPDNPNFPYRRYDRLPPIHQFSIESDTDLSETAELIEEYDVFDPTRPRPKIILVIGGPGSGKGTQSLKIAERYGFEYISVGELLRKKIHSTSSNRKWSLIAKIITTGELAPQETTITEIKQRLMQIPDEEGIVIDGFPRDVAQALSFEDQVSCLFFWLQLHYGFCNAESRRGLYYLLLPPFNGITSVMFNLYTPMIIFAYDESVIFSLIYKFIFTYKGGPGSGKGTQCKKLAQKYGFMHLSIEDLIQNETASGRSKNIRDITESGEFIPGDIVTELLKEAILANMENSKGFLIDGYPQEIQQGEQFENEIGEPSLVLCMDCSSKTMSTRLLQKSQCLEDNVEAIMKCIEAYYKTAEPLIAYYENTIPFFKVDCLDFLLDLSSVYVVTF